MKIDMIHIDDRAIKILKYGFVINTHYPHPSMMYVCKELRLNFI